MQEAVEWALAEEEEELVAGDSLPTIITADLGDNWSIARRLRIIAGCTVSEEDEEITVEGMIAGWRLYRHCLRRFFAALPLSSIPFQP